MRSFRNSYVYGLGGSHWADRIYGWRGWVGGYSMEARMMTHGVLRGGQAILIQSVGALAPLQGVDGAIATDVAMWGLSCNAGTRSKPVADVPRGGSSTNLPKRALYYRSTSFRRTMYWYNLPPYKYVSVAFDGDFLCHWAINGASTISSTGGVQLTKSLRHNSVHAHDRLDAVH